MGLRLGGGQLMCPPSNGLVLAVLSWNQQSMWDLLLRHALGGLYLGNAKPSSPRGPSQLTSISKCAGLPVSTAPNLEVPVLCPGHSAVYISISLELWATTPSIF